MYILKSFGFNAVAKIIDAIIKFLAIPVLLSFFGENNFGIITTVIAINAYLLILVLLNFIVSGLQAVKIIELIFY